jgi:hypothetical protein
MHWVASKVFVGLHSLRDGYIQWERLGIEYENNAEILVHTCSVSCGGMRCDSLMRTLPHHTSPSSIERNE